LLCSDINFHVLITSLHNMIRWHVWGFFFNGELISSKFNRSLSVDGLVCTFIHCDYQIGCWWYHLLTYELLLGYNLRRGFSWLLYNSFLFLSPVNWLWFWIINRRILISQGELMP
jgi:hypothetical protein